MSQPSWAAWIEIRSVQVTKPPDALSQPSWAAWIEISSLADGGQAIHRRSPLGLRGLK